MEPGSAAEQNTAEVSSIPELSRVDDEDHHTHLSNISLNQNAGSKYDLDKSDNLPQQSLNEIELTKATAEPGDSDEGGVEEPMIPSHSQTEKNQESSESYSDFESTNGNHQVTSTTVKERYIRVLQVFFSDDQNYIDYVYMCV